MLSIFSDERVSARAAPADKVIKIVAVGALWIRNKEGGQIWVQVVGIFPYQKSYSALTMPMQVSWNQSSQTTHWSMVLSSFEGSYRMSHLEMQVPVSVSPLCLLSP